MKPKIYTTGNQEAVPEAFQQRSRSVFRPFQQRSRPVPKSYLARDWNEKAQRNAKNNRYVPEKIIVNLILLIGCFTETLMEFPPLYQIVSYLLLFAVFMASDPLDALTRVLAPQTRCITGLSACMVIVVIIKPYRPLIMIVITMIVSGLVAIRIFNRSWLASYNWLMSAEVQNALLIDTDNRATKAWQAHGRRETRTLLHELGHPATDDVLDIIHRPIYIAGYLNGYEKTAKHNQKIEKLENTAQKYKDATDNLTEQLKAIRKENQSLMAEQKELQARCTEAEQQGTHWYKLYQSEHKLAEQLEAANTELLNAIDSPADQVEQKSNLKEIKSQTLEEKVLSALAAGASYAEAGKLAGCSKSKAYRIHKDATENKIVQL